MNPSPRRTRDSAQPLGFLVRSKTVLLRRSMLSKEPDCVGAHLPAVQWWGASRGHPRAPSPCTLVTPGFCVLLEIHVYAVDFLKSWTFKQRLYFSETCDRSASGCSSALRNILLITVGPLQECTSPVLNISDTTPPIPVLQAIYAKRTRSQ